MPDTLRSLGVEEPKVCPDAAAVINALRDLAKAGQSEWVEQRRFPRSPFIRQAKLRVIGITRPDDPILAFTYNASEASLGVVSPRPLPIGAEANVNMIAPGGALLHLEGYVTRSRPVAGWYDMGIVFYRGHPALGAAEFRRHA